jgi:hypothetical protein
VLTDASPGEPEEHWEDVVEVSIDVPPGTEVGWTSWAGESGGVLAGIAPGTYRLRVSARGRDTARVQEFADGQVDAYLLQLWPAASEPDAILRTTTQDAQYWHHEWEAAAPEGLVWSSGATRRGRRCCWI